SPRHPPSHDRALPAPHQRQSRALPPDDGTRMGIRARLPNTSTPQHRPATLAQRLQPATATQLNRRPTPDQPRSQPPWVGQLGTQLQRLPARFGIDGASFTADGSRIVTVDASVPAIEVWDARTGRRLATAHAKNF